MGTASFSVVVPLYNKAYMVERCLASVAKQTHLPSEVIVVDDGSTDNSLALVEEFKLNNPWINLRIFTQENSGVSAARNKGASLASHELVCFLDADDEWKPDFLQVMENLIQDYPDAVLYCLGHEVVNDKGEVKAVKHGCSADFRGYVEDFFKVSSKGSVAKSSKVCVRKKVLIEVGGFPEGVVAGEDIYVWSMLALHGRVACESNPMAIVNQQEDESRSARKKATVPYPIVFFGQNSHYMSTCPSLRCYLTSVAIKHLLASIQRGNYKEAFHRWWAYRKINYIGFFISSLVFMIPPKVISVLR